MSFGLVLYGVALSMKLLNSIDVWLLFHFLTRQIGVWFSWCGFYSSCHHSCNRGSMRSATIIVLCISHTLFPDQL